jgi:exonuclease VII large subunit
MFARAQHMNHGAIFQTKLSEKIPDFPIRKQECAQTAIQTEDQTLRNKIQTELIRLKNQKPELFYITDQEQISQITTQLRALTPLSLTFTGYSIVDLRQTEMLGIRGTKKPDLWLDW